MEKFKEYPINEGYCLICEDNATFIKERAWLRDFYFCSKCRSIPRQRAVINSLNRFCSDWKTKKIYESSPCGPSSKYIQKMAMEYVFSHFFPDVKSGVIYKYENNEILCQNIEEMSFEDESFDIVITQDVLEHIFDYEAAFREISRILKPGGIHLFTVPLYQDLDKSRKRAERRNGKIEYLKEPVYHGDPVNGEGVLVVIDWGNDICDIIYECSKMTTTIYLCENEYLGLNAQYLEVFISRKSR